MPMNNRQKCSIAYKARKKSAPASNGCIVWTGTKNHLGYGLIEYTDEVTKKRHCLPIHRAIYMIVNNIHLSRHELVLHKCDNRACINDKHLFKGTQKDNMQDMIAKGRQVTVKGRKLGPRKRRTKREIYIAERGSILAG